MTRNHGEIFTLQTRSYSNPDLNGKLVHIVFGKEGLDLVDVTFIDAITGETIKTSRIRSARAINDGIRIITKNYHEYNFVNVKKLIPTRSSSEELTNAIADLLVTLLK